MKKEELIELTKECDKVVLNGTYRHKKNQQVYKVDSRGAMVIPSTALAIVVYVATSTGKKYVKTVEHFLSGFEYLEPMAKPLEIKVGVKYLTRDGKVARVIAIDRKARYPILALIENDDGAENIYSYTKDGAEQAGRKPCDLVSTFAGEIEKPVKQEKQEECNCPLCTGDLDKIMRGLFGIKEEIRVAKSPANNTVGTVGEAS